MICGLLYVHCIPSACLCRLCIWICHFFLLLNRDVPMDGQGYNVIINAFKRNMENICRKRPGWQKKPCRHFVHIYWTAVRAGGGIVHPNPKIYSWCGKSCAKTFGNL